MPKNFIKELQERVEESSKSKAGQEEKDKQLAILSETKGWEVLRERIEGKILLLLEPGADQTMELEKIGAITMARELSLHFLRSIIQEVEGTKEYLQEMKRREREGEGKAQIIK